MGGAVAPFLFGGLMIEQINKIIFTTVKVNAIGLGFVLVVLIFFALTTAYYSSMYQKKLDENLCFEKENGKYKGCYIDCENKCLKCFEILSGDYGKAPE